MERLRLCRPRDSGEFSCKMIVLNASKCNSLKFDCLDNGEKMIKLGRPWCKCKTAA